MLCYNVSGEREGTGVMPLSTVSSSDFSENLVFWCVLNTVGKWK
jgi:hypothetical protein